MKRMLFVVRCLIHGRLRRHSHCWDCDRPVYDKFTCNKGEGCKR